MDAHPKYSRIASWRKPPNLHWFECLTTPIGIWQHATRVAPKPHFGFTTDDAGRALVVVSWYAERFGTSDRLIELAKIFVDFLSRAQRLDGQFHNFADRQGRWIDQKGSEDTQGRAAWGISEAERTGVGPQKILRALYRKLSPHLSRLRHPRAVAYALLGATAVGDRKVVKTLSAYLCSLYERNASPQWPWFHDQLTYSNAMIPYALLVATGLLNDPTARRVGLSTLEFLDRVSRADGTPAPVGNRGWYRQGGQRALFDQQPVDAAALVLANGEAYRVTGEQRYRDESFEWFGWFFRNNIHGIPLVSADGGCSDSLTRNGLNPNRGAESTIAYLLAHLALARLVE